MGFDYWTELGNSFVDLKNNLVLVVPLILSGIAVGAAFFFLILANLLMLAAVGGFGLLSDLSIDTIYPFIVSNIPLIIVLGIIDIVVLIAVSSFFTAGFLGMVNQVRQTRKTSFSVFGDSAKKYYSGVFKTGMLALVLQGWPLVLVLLIFGRQAVSLLNKPDFSGIMLFVVSAAALFFIFGIYYLFMYVVLFFLQPSIIYGRDRNLGAVAIIKQSARFTFRNFVHFLAVMGILLLLGLGTGIVNQILSLPVKIMEPAAEGLFLPLLFTSIFISLITFVVNTTVSIVSSIYLFKAYFAKVK